MQLPLFKSFMFVRSCQPLRLSSQNFASHFLCKTTLSKTFSPHYFCPSTSMTTKPSTTSMSVAELRVNYSNEPLLEKDLDETPFPLFKKWIEEATAANEHEPNAMCLSTVDENHRPSARMVLLKAFDEQGFVWYTNYTSRKAEQLKLNPNAALTFWWPTLERSIRIEGTAHVADPSESDAYFNSRPVTSRLGAWASDQSAPLMERSHLEEKWDNLKHEYMGKDGQLQKTLSRPPFWGGYRLVPSRIEFWKGRSARLHDRIVYERDGASIQNWKRMRLQP